LRPLIAALAVFLSKYQNKIGKDHNDLADVSYLRALHVLNMLRICMKAARNIVTDCLVNYETVRYFGTQEHERKRYAEAVRKLQAKEYKLSGTWHRILHVHQRVLTYFSFHLVFGSLDDLGQSLIFVSQFDVNFLSHVHCTNRVSPDWSVPCTLDGLSLRVR
jgi:hypothetical protein